MKKLIILIILLVLPTFAVAEEKEEYKYKGLSGTRYKYDLSKPRDRIKYSVDPRSQLTDKIYMPIKPGVQIDRSLNQYGGGVKR